MTGWGHFMEKQTLVICGERKKLPKADEAVESFVLEIYVSKWQKKKKNRSYNAT